MQNVFSSIFSQFSPANVKRVANTATNTAKWANNLIKPVQTQPQPKVAPKVSPATNPTYGPLKSGYVQSPGYVAPAPKVQPPTVAPAPDPYAAYNANYNASLQQSKMRKEQQAAADKAESERSAQEQYDANKGTYNTARTNIDQLMGQYRDRIAASDARLTKVAGQNRERATTTSGENQRQLAIDRRQAMNDTEKRYAALGTLDSFGTGSFQTAIENKDSDFMRLTAKNKQETEYALNDIDNKLFDAKAKIEEQKAIEEGKYNDAVAQINSLLANDEVSKNQALRAASLLYQQKIGQINDENDSLTLAAEKEKADLQQKNQAASMADQNLRAIMQSASPEFLQTGVPKTAQDQFIVMKYPKEMETYMKLLTDGKSLSGNGGEKQKLISLVDDISSSSGLGRISGLKGVIPLLPGSSEQLVKGQIEQLKAILSLEGRQKLKGSGAISDREMGILERASSLLNQNLSEDQMRQVLTQLKTEISSGQPASISALPNGQVKMVAPDGSQYTVDQAEAAQAAQNGWKLAQ